MTFVLTCYAFIAVGFIVGLMTAAVLGANGRNDDDNPPPGCGYQPKAAPPFRSLPPRAP